ncbi:hypothetical protein [Vibrio owensii]|uniref:hypothetical protein n=1 Tax=Vibrio owensii TaxID=696485 RepID=UPI003CC53CA9
MRQKIEQFAIEREVEIMLADGLDDALVGISSSDDEVYNAVYSVEKCIKAFEEQGMTREEAEEYFEFNTRGSYMGPGTPIYIDTLDDY